MPKIFPLTPNISPKIFLYFIFIFDFAFGAPFAFYSVFLAYLAYIIHSKNRWTDRSFKTYYYVRWVVVFEFMLGISPSVFPTIFGKNEEKTKITNAWMVLGGIMMASYTTFLGMQLKSALQESAKDKSD